MWAQVNCGLRTLEDKTIELKGSEWRLYSCRCSIICRSYQRLQCMFLKQFRSQKLWKILFELGSRQ